MDKLASVVLEFDKRNAGYYLSLVKRIEEITCADVGGLTIAVVPVKDFILTDHQFIQLKVKIENGKEMQIWIPRNMVKAILEGKTDASAAFSFVGSKTK